MWLNGEIIGVNFHILIYKFKKISKDRKQVFITYTGYAEKFNEWFDMDSK